MRCSNNAENRVSLKTVKLKSNHDVIYGKSLSVQRSAYTRDAKLIEELATLA